jgi:transcriptional regulator with XRE-family HTH domain
MLFRQTFVKKHFSGYAGDMTSTPSDVVASRVRTLRTRRGWSGKELQARCAAVGAKHITAAVIANIETGRRGPSGERRREVTVDEVLALALALDVSPIQLIQPEIDDDVSISVTSLIHAVPTAYNPWLMGEQKSISVSLLDGLALCRTCRTPLAARSYSQEVWYFCPNNRCPAPVVDCAASVANRRVADMYLMFDEDITAAAANEIVNGDLLDTVAEINMEIDELKMRRADVVTKFESLVDYQELDPQTSARAIASFDKRIKERQRDIDNLTRKTDLIPIRASLREEWDTIPAANLRLMMATLGTVTVGADCSVDTEWVWEKTGDDA